MSPPAPASCWWSDPRNKVTRDVVRSVVAMVQDRVRSCLLAGAIGDAWGGPYENMPRGEAREFPLEPVLSDDTTLTLATCEALTMARGSPNPAVIAERFRAWFDAGAIRGVGSATLKALRDLSNGAHWALSGSRGEFAAGTGAAMRVAPLAFILDASSDIDRTSLRDICRITHHNDEAYAGALAVVVAVRLAASSEGVPVELLSSVIDLLPDTAVRDRLVEVAGAHTEPIQAAAAACRGSGHVVDAVPLALSVAMAHPTSVEAAIREAVNLGGDADTVASIAAQLVGAGGAAAPAHLCRRLPGLDKALRIIDEFTNHVRPPDTERIPAS